jgi:DNA-binding CsgD family transcriptional regulator
MMPETLRNSGIPFLDDVPWSSHLCVFYETRNDLIVAAARFFERGLDSNELCIWAVPAHLAADDAVIGLREQVSDFDDHVAAGRLRFVAASDWYPPGAADDARQADSLWNGLLEDALAGGHDGLRASGDAAWLARQRPDDASSYDAAIAQRLAGRPALALSSYDLATSSGADVLDVARLHGLSVACRHGEWQPFETASWRGADLESTLAAMAAAIPGFDQVTERERMVLGLLLRGASSKEVGRDLGISPRTADFHRANIIGKLGARNTADLIRRVLSRR